MSLSCICPGVAKLIVTLSPDMRSYSGTRLVITARAPPVESTVISAAVTGLARPSAKTTSAVAVFMVSSCAIRLQIECIRKLHRRSNMQNHAVPTASLFRTSRETPSDHLDFVKRARSPDIQCLLGRPAECDILAVCRRAAHGYDSEVLPFRAQDLDTAAGGDVEPVVVVERHAVRERLDSA